MLAQVECWRAVDYTEHKQHGLLATLPSECCWQPPLPQHPEPHARQPVRQHEHEPLIVPNLYPINRSPGWCNVLLREEADGSGAYICQLGCWKSACPLAWTCPRTFAAPSSLTCHLLILMNSTFRQHTSKYMSCWLRSDFQTKILRGTNGAPSLI